MLEQQLYYAECCEADVLTTESASNMLQTAKFNSKIVFLK